jgi:hypothetical protein
MSSPEPNEEKLERLARALRNAEEGHSIFVPPTLDEAILKQAQQHLRGTKRRRGFRFFPWLALPAAMALIVILIFLIPHTKTRTFVREDINGDGQVDILDALTLAKALDNGASTPKFDQNDDGKVDETDVRAIAAAAVRLVPKS